MGYGTLEWRFWDDPDLQELGLAGMAVAAYLVTSQHSSSEGYYRLPLGYVCDDLCVDRDTALGYLRAIDLKNFARYDEATQVVFIRNAMRYRPPRGIKTITGAVRRALDVSMNPFRSLFYDAAHHYAPEFALALADAGFCPSEMGVPERQPSLFERSTPPLPLALPSGERASTQVEQILASAAQFSVQRSIARREPIRSPEAVAKARLAQHAAEWRGLVKRWLDYFEVSDDDMAKALADGGTARPHWRHRDMPATS